MSKLLHNRVQIGDWARISIGIDALINERDRISWETFEGRVTSVSAHRVTIYNDPAASTLGNVAPQTGPITIRRVDVQAIEVNLGHPR